MKKQFKLVVAIFAIMLVGAVSAFAVEPDDMRLGLYTLTGKVSNGYSCALARRDNNEKNPVVLVHGTVRNDVLEVEKLFLLKKQKDGSYFAADDYITFKDKRTIEWDDGTIRTHVSGVSISWTKFKKKEAANGYYDYIMNKW